MTEQTPEARPPILSEQDVTCQKEQLARLWEALAALGIRSVPANNHRLCLWFEKADSYKESGLTAPTLNVFTSGGLTVVLMKGEIYTLRSGIALSDDVDKAARILSEVS